MSARIDSHPDTADSPRRARGRPSVMDKHAVAAAAVALWSERGLTTTSWSDLAEATGVSARTLIRHFPDKRDIAWLGVRPATRRLRLALDQIPETTDLNTAIREAIVASVSHDRRITKANPSWLALISSEPELSSMAAQAFRPWIDELATYIGARIQHVPNAIRVSLATTYQAAAFAALTEWATDTDAPGNPADAVDAMLRWIDIRTPAAD